MAAFSGRVGIVLKGARIGILKRIQPVSIHGQISYDVFFMDIDDPEGQVHAARLGPEAVAPDLEPGDRVQIDYLVGVAVRIAKAPTDVRR